VHSHAAASKSSGAFFGVMGRERCRKRPDRAKISLTRSGEGRERDVMVNLSVLQVQKKPRRASE